MEDSARGGPANCLGEHSVEFDSRRTPQHERCGAAKRSAFERRSQADHPEAGGKAAFVRTEALADLALDQHAGHRTTRMALRHDGSDPEAGNRLSTVIHRFGPMWCAIC